MISVWFVAAGGVLVLMALAGSLLKRLPLTAPMLYLVIGVLLGPIGFGLIRFDPLRDPKTLEHVAELTVIISLFTAGLKLGTPLTLERWRSPLRLALLSMAVNVGLVAAVGVWCLNLPLGAAILLGAILAPTDPVLASDVQVEDVEDRDRLRFGLTGEAGLNDGAAFPFVMLGLGLLGLHSLGEMGWKWWTVDVVWAAGAGLAVGALLGLCIGRLVLHLRRTHREAVGLDNFLALGLICLAYGAALLIHSYGFLAVFAAGIALRHVELSDEQGETGPEITVKLGAAPEAEPAVDPRTAPAYMAHAVLHFNEQLERIAEAASVVLLGVCLSSVTLRPEMLWFTPLLFLCLRPVSVLLGLAGNQMEPVQRRLSAWFGIRGVGSLYYLAFAMTHGLPAELARPLFDLTLVTVAASVVVHGVTATPLMQRYERRQAPGLRRRATG